MRAQNLTISIPGRQGYKKDCDKNCPYCVSDMTFWPEDNSLIKMGKQLSKVRKLANSANITSVLLTAKGEPFLNFETLIYIASWFKDYPLEVQTNGKKLLTNLIDMTDQMNMVGINIVAFSIDKIEQFQMLSPAFSYLKENGFIIRITLNVSNLLNDAKFDDILDKCKYHKIDQLMLRKITTPEQTPETHPSAKWITENAPADLYNSMVRRMEFLTKTEGWPIREIPFYEDDKVVEIYDLHGISISASKYCIQEYSKTSDIRSLIWLPDGHIYTSWGSKASVLF